MAGCLLVAGGIACLALLPEASVLWTIVPQLLAGVGMGMAFPALAGELLPERTRGQAAALLSLRHAGITLALVALAPLVAAELDQQVELARERGTALVLDAALPPSDKIDIAPRLFADIESEDPRDALARAMARERRRVAREDRDLLSRIERLEGQLGDEGGLGSDLLGRLEGLEDEYGDDLAEGLSELEEQLGTSVGSDLLDRLRERVEGGSERAPVLRELRRLEDDLDDVVLVAVDAAFSPAFVLTGGLALLAALALLPGLHRRGRTVILRARRGLHALPIGAALALSILAALAYARRGERPRPRARADRRPLRGARAPLGRRRGGLRRGRGAGRDRPRGLPLRLLARGAGAGPLRRRVPARVRARARRGPARAGRAAEEVRSACSGAGAVHASPEHSAGCSGAGAPGQSVDRGAGATTGAPMALGTRATRSASAAAPRACGSGGPARRRPPRSPATSFVTTALVPITALSPTVAPRSTQAP